MPQSPPWPGYAARQPLYPAIRQLNLWLGRQGNVVDVMEVAARYLAEQAELERDGDAWVRTLAKRFRVPASHLRVEATHAGAARMYIDLTYESVDRHLRRLIREVVLYKERKWSYSEGSRILSPLEQLTKNLSPLARERLGSTPEFHLLEYYRLVRNSIVHEGRATEASLDAEYRRLLNYKSHFDGYQLQAPNALADIQYHDYRLLTRAIRYFSQVINDACDLRPHDVARHIAGERGEGVYRNSLLASPPGKRRHKAIRYFRAAHGGAEGDDELFADELLLRLS